jgi:2,5-dihydroxypyridine 5,6-dioxygenase
MMSVSKLKILQSASNIMTAGGVKKGDQVVLLADTHSDARVIESLQAAADSVGVLTTTVIGTEFPHYGDPFGKTFVDSPPKAVLNALAGVDLVVEVYPVMSVTWKPFFDAIRAAKKGAKSIGQFGDAEIMSSEMATYPLEVIYTILKKVREFLLASGGGTFKVTTPSGSNFSGGFNPEKLNNALTNGNPVPGPLLRGQSITFPLAVCGFMHPDVRGVAVCDRYRGFRGDLREPIALTYEKGIVTKIEGGEEATYLRSKLGLGKATCSHTLFGANPKASLSRDRDEPSHREAERSPACIDIHADVEGVDRSCGYLLHPTLTINDKVLIDNGRLLVLEDPEVRAVASNYGNPDRLLDRML